MAVLWRFAVEPAARLEVGKRFERGAAGPRRGYANCVTSDSLCDRAFARLQPKRAWPDFCRPANSRTQATLSAAKTPATVKKLLTPTPAPIEIAARLESRLAGRRGGLVVAGGALCRSVGLRPGQRQSESASQARYARLPISAGVKGLALVCGRDPAKRTQTLTLDQDWHIHHLE